MGECVAFLDDDADLRETLVELLELEYHRPCLPVASHAELVENAERILGCGLAILDVNLGHGAPSGVDSYEWLRAHGFKGKVVFLTGHARSHPLVQQAAALGEARVFEKPITLQSLEALLGEAVP